MTQFRYMRGAVYILENVEAQRVKVGMTINDVALRLKDVNDMWLGFKGTCQVCGARRLTKWDGRKPRRVMPKHSVNGLPCPGGKAQPLEDSVELAKSTLAALEARLATTTTKERSATERRISALEEMMRLRHFHVAPVGIWTINTVYHTDCAEHVELLSHKLLAAQLDTAAPFGEVFRCSVPQAQAAIENTLSQLNLLDQATRENPQRETNAA